MYRILIADENPDTAALTARWLTEAGYRTECVTEFSHPPEEYRPFRPHIILLVLNDLQGQVPRWYRGFRHTLPENCLWLLPEERVFSDRSARLLGPNRLRRPFSRQQLLTMVDGLLRALYEPERRQEYGNGMRLEMEPPVLIWRERRVSLSERELTVLRMLLTHRGSVVTREALEEETIVRCGGEPEPRMIPNILSRLRRKLSNAGLEDPISTRKGKGWLIE